MLKTFDFHSFIQRPHFSQIAKNDFRASFFTPADIAPYLKAWLCQSFRWANLMVATRSGIDLTALIFCQPKPKYSGKCLEFLVKKQNWRCD